MGLRFLRPCTKCNRLSRNGNWCLDCAREAARKRQYSRGTQPYSTYAWQRLSADIRANHPWCAQCGSTDKRLTVHHLDALKPGENPVVPADRLVVLCTSCHGAVTKHRVGGVKS
jgi:5-methylcytosine-specific restriction endonuclease McrA